VDDAWIAANLPSDGQGNAVIYTDDTGPTLCPVATMVAMFGSVATTHAALSATSQAKAGWQACFDQWKASGIVA
jgi:hypothetical protein